MITVDLRFEQARIVEYDLDIHHIKCVDNVHTGTLSHI